MPLAGDLIRASDAFQLNTATPSFSNITLGSGAVSEIWWQQLGEMVMWGMRVEFAGSPVWGPTLSVTMALPVTAYAGGGGSLGGALGTWAARDSGTANYAGVVAIFDSGGVNATFSGAWDGSSPKARIGVGSGVPFTLGAGDVLSASGIYRAA